MSEFTPVPVRSGPSLESLASLVVDGAYQLYRALGPSLRESVYERLLAHDLGRLGLSVHRQHPINFQYAGLSFVGGFRADLLINETLLVEVKSVELMSAVHVKQTLTYLRLMDLPLGLLLNFGAPRFRDVVRRVVNNHVPSSDSRLRIHRAQDGDGEAR